MDKYLADMGLGTRSEVKKLLKKGCVCVNGETEKKPERKVDPKKDQVTVDGVSVSYEEYEYYMLNKPAGVLSAARDKKQPTVLDLIESDRKDLFPVGRLDKDTTGFVLLTDDGEFAHSILSPSKHIDKTYVAHLDKRSLVVGTHRDIILVCRRFAACRLLVRLVRAVFQAQQFIERVRLIDRARKFGKTEWF